MTKTGGWGGPWVELEKPRPPRVDRYEYWIEEPPEISERCQYWLRQIERGWRPNGGISSNGYDTAAEWYGVYMWEYLNLIYPKLESLRPPRRSPFRLVVHDDGSLEVRTAPE